MILQQLPICAKIKYHQLLSTQVRKRDAITLEKNSFVFKDCKICLMICD